MEGVRAALAAYTFALDDGRVDDVVATYCADGECDIPVLGSHRGHKALREAYDKVRPRVPQRHIVVNILVSDWDDHTANVLSDVVFLYKGEAGWTVGLIGRFSDVLHNESGTWRFHRRSAEWVT